MGTARVPLSEGPGVVPTREAPQGERLGVNNVLNTGKVLQEGEGRPPTASQFPWEAAGCGEESRGQGHSRPAGKRELTLSLPAAGPASQGLQAPVPPLLTEVKHLPNSVSGWHETQTGSSGWKVRGPTSARRLGVLPSPLTF